MEKPEFLLKYKEFQLGELPTENPHPLTEGLAELSQTDLQKALDLLKQVDVEALEVMSGYLDEIQMLREECLRVLSLGSRIFLCGCGATGRLALLIESLWRQSEGGGNEKAFMAGGDIALVHSLEGFEDYPELGARHLRQLGFNENDLLISVTEGGETPFVIGATLEASKISKHKPWFLFCNPESVLKTTVKRSHEVLTNKDVVTLELGVGPMSLAGSTRMQASTVLQLALGLALLPLASTVKSEFNNFLNSINGSSFK